MTEREKFEKWLNTLDKQTLVTMAAKQARTIEELQAATKAAVPQWIPVSERLPFDGERVLIFDNGGTYGAIYTLQYYDDFILRHKYVTHWMPLPNSPKE